MNLYLHIGTEKTGSSYLQNIMALNRDILAKSSIYFPKANTWLSEELMLEGKTSPGNGQFLKKCLTESNFNQLEKYLSNMIEKARQNKCTSILLSNENIIRGLANSNNYHLFNELMDELKINEVFGLLVLRDPTSLALSMYKHRSKSGKTPHISDWLENDFDNIIVLNDFLQHHDQYAIKWTFRKYQNNSESLINLLFIDWLGIKRDELLINEQLVNPSLTLSELEIIRQLRKNNPELVEECYKRFLSIPVSEKANNDSIELLYRNIIGQKLGKWSKTVNAFNDLLAKNEKLILHEISAELEEIESYNFHQAQLGVLIELISVSNLLKKRIRYMIRRLLSNLPDAFRLRLVYLKRILKKGNT